MIQALKDAPGIFTFNVTDTSGTYAIHNEIPKQVLTLVYARVEFDTSAHALTSQNLKIKFPFVSMFHVIDNDPNRFNVVIPLKNAVETSWNTKEDYWMIHDVHENFDYYIIDETGSAPAGFVRCTLKFQFTKSITS